MCVLLAIPDRAVPRLVARRDREVRRDRVRGAIADQSASAGAGGDTRVAADTGAGDRGRGTALVRGGGVGSVHVGRIRGKLGAGELDGFRRHG